MARSNRKIEAAEYYSFAVLVILSRVVIEISAVHMCYSKL
jgi:hypothetical protein